jgi:hypothetical protein
MPRKSAIATLQADLDRLQDRALYADKTKLPALIARTHALQAQLQRRFERRVTRKQTTCALPEPRPVDPGGVCPGFTLPTAADLA